MFEDFFTTYSMVEPPKVYKANPALTIRDIEESNITKYPMTVILNNQSEDVWNYPEIVNPSNNKHSIESENRIISIPAEQGHPVKKELKGSKSFEEAFEEAVKINPEVANYRNFLIKTAKKESNFNSYIQNTAGAPYYGYFQMGKEEIKKTTGLSVEEFRNNPVQQILGAVKLYKMNLKTMKAIGIYNLGKENGYSDDALVAGAWLGGPGGVKKYLKGLGDPSDSHWYKNGKGTSVGTRMKEFNE